MTRSRFMVWSACLLVIFLFIKIYQHNQMVKLGYLIQRVEREKELLVKRKSDLQVELACLQDPLRVQAIAEEKLGMRPLKPSQVVNIK